jgi:hypothetical protein
VEYDQSAVEAFFSGIFKSPMSSELSYRLDQALEVTDALWELLPIVVAAGEQHDRLPPADMADQSAAARRLTVDQRGRVRMVADAVLGMQEGASSAGQEFNESVVSGLTMQQAVADPFGILNRLMDVPEQTALVVSMLEQAASLSPDEIFYFRAYIRARQTAERTPMLLRVLFVIAVGTVEPLLTRLVILLLYYGSPQKYGSLAAAELEADARKLCFGGPEMWRQSLVAKLGITTLTTAVDWDRLVSLWEDRNVIVHRGSVTDSRHSAKTKTEAWRVLSPDVDMVRAAIDVMGGTRYALAACVWEHLEPGKGDVAAQMAGPLAWESLRAGRWEQAELLGRLGQALAAAPDDKATSQVHQWLAIDARRDPEAIRPEVEAWDVTDLPRIYTVARHVLLRQDEQARATLSELLDAGEIDQSDIDTWPLFDRLRGEERLPET